MTPGHTHPETSRKNWGRHAGDWGNRHPPTITPADYEAMREEQRRRAQDRPIAADNPTLRLIEEELAKPSSMRRGPFAERTLWRLRRSHAISKEKQAIRRRGRSPAPCGRPTATGEACRVASWSGGPCRWHEAMGGRGAGGRGSDAPRRGSVAAGR